MSTIILDSKQRHLLFYYFYFNNNIVQNKILYINKVNQEYSFTEHEQCEIKNRFIITRKMGDKIWSKKVKGKEKKSLETYISNNRWPIVIESACEWLSIRAIPSVTLTLARNQPEESHPRNLKKTQCTEKRLA